MIRFVLADLRRYWAGVVAVVLLIAFATALGMAVRIEERALRLGEPVDVQAVPGRGMRGQALCQCMSRVRAIRFGDRGSLFGDHGFFTTCLKIKQTAQQQQPEKRRTE